MVIRINDGENADGNLIVGEPQMYDASTLFTGGVPPLTYEAEVTGTNMAHLTAENTDGGAMVTITVDEDALATLYSAENAASDPLDATRMEVKLTATDSAGAQTETTIYVIRNKPPTVPTGAPAIPNLNIGTQMAEKLEGSNWPGGTDYMCEMMNSCVLTLSHASGGQFEDDDETLTYSAVSDDTSKVQVSTNDDGKLVIMGVGSTERDDATAETFDDDGVTITVTATDEGGLMSEEKTFKVLVNAQPARSDVAIPLVKLDDGARPLDVSVFLEDEDTLAYTVLDNDATEDGPFPYVTVTSTGSVVTFTPTENGLNGTRMVTIRAAEPEGAAISATGSVGQYLDITITVENASN